MRKKAIPFFRNERVVGSNPISGSRKHAGSRNRGPVFFVRNAPRLYLELFIVSGALA